MRLGIFGGLGRLGTKIAELAKNYQCVDAIIVKDTKKKQESISFDEFFASCDVIIDASCAQGAESLVNALAGYDLEQNSDKNKEKKALVIGSTGHHSDVESMVAKIIKNVPVLYAPNASQSLWFFLRSVTLMAENLGPSWDVHLYDHHHKDKQDAPSGTVLYFVNHLISVCPWLENRIQWSSVRGGKGMILNSVLFSGNNEVIQCTHQVLDITVFAKGLLDGALWLTSCSPGYYDVQYYIRNKQV